MTKGLKHLCTLMIFLLTDVIYKYIFVKAGFTPLLPLPSYTNTLSETKFPALLCLLFFIIKFQITALPNSLLKI